MRAWQSSKRLGEIISRSGSTPDVTTKFWVFSYFGFLVGEADQLSPFFFSFRV
jgi:hypothetical protein